MIKVVSFKICPFVQRVTALLEAKGIAYALEYIDLANKPDWFLQLSPHGQVPLLLTESGAALFESDAIVEYIDEITPLLDSEAAPERRALDRAWSQLATKNYLAQCSLMRSDSEQVLRERNAQLGNALARVESALGEGPYFNGAVLGNVDIAWLVLLHRAVLIHRRTGYDMLAEYPKVRAWQAQLMATGLAEASVAADFEAVFAGFYLSEATYLGREGKRLELLPRAVAACC